MLALVGHLPVVFSVSSHSRSRALSAEMHYPQWRNFIGSVILRNFPQMVSFFNSFEFVEIKVNDLTETQHRNELFFIRKHF